MHGVDGELRVVAPTSVTEPGQLDGLRGRQGRDNRRPGERAEFGEATAMSANASTSHNEPPAANVTGVEPVMVDERGAAKMLAVCPRTVFTLAAAGELHPTYIGTAKRYLVADLRAFAARRQAEAVQRRRPAANDPTTPSERLDNC